MKAIILTTDLSNESLAAFAKAVELAQTFKSKVYLLAVIEDPAQAAFAYALDFPVFPDPDIHKQVIEKVRSDLKELAAKHLSNVTYETVVEEATGSVHGTIIDFARSHKADVIILSTHGRTGLSRMLIGSVAERVIRESECPVLVVPSKKA